MKYHRLSNF